LRHTSLLPGQFPANKRDKWPDSCAGNANYHNCRAVSTNTCPDFELASHLNPLNHSMIKSICNIYRDNALAQRVPIKMHLEKTALNTMTDFFHGQFLDIKTTDRTCANFFKYHQYTDSLVLIQKS